MYTIPKFKISLINRMNSLFTEPIFVANHSLSINFTIPPPVSPIKTRGFKRCHSPSSSSPCKRIRELSAISPYTAAIVETVSPSKQEAFLETIKTIPEKVDKEFVPEISATRTGAEIEKMFPKIATCPICREKSFGVFRSNMPVVDLICTNAVKHLEKKECFLWQLKVSSDPNDNYFSKKNKFFIPGSSKKRDEQHFVSASKPLEDKMIVPGYIFLHLKKVRIPNTDSSVKAQKYIVNQNKSFVLSPNYQREDDENYYFKAGVGAYGGFKMSWNETLVDLKLIQSVISEPQISLEDYPLKKIKNPFCCK